MYVYHSIGHLSLLPFQALSLVVVVVDHVGGVTALGHGEVAKLRYEFGVHGPLRLHALVNRGVALVLKI